MENEEVTRMVKVLFHNDTVKIFTTKCSYARNGMYIIDIEDRNGRLIEVYEYPLCTIKEVKAKRI